MHKAVAIIAQEQDIGRLEYHRTVDARLRDWDYVVPVLCSQTTSLAMFPALFADGLDN